MQASKLIETRYDAYTTAGNFGSGLPTTLSINGLPASNTILKAYLWYFVSYTEAGPPPSTVAITNPATNTSNVNSVVAGTSGSKCWAEAGSAVYRAEVTSAISGNGNYILNISGFTNPAWEVDGATLFIIYKDPNANYQGSLVIWDVAMATSSGADLSQTGTGFNVCSTPGTARAFAISSDHQDNTALTHTTTLNGAISNFPNNMFSYDEAPVTLTSGQTTSAFGESAGGTGDCYLWGVMGLYYQTTNCTVCSPCPATSVSIDSVKNNSSCTLNNGAVYLGASTTAGPLTYNWSNGATTQDITGLFSGTYSVTIKDTTNCITAYSFNISSPANIFISFDSITTVSCNGANGVIHAMVTGGTPPYTYNWSNTATTQNITGLAYGNYTLKVTDSNGCITISSASDKATVNVATPSICMVTVDSLSQYNVILWDKTAFAPTDSFIVYREIGVNNYKPVGVVPYPVLSLFIDTVRTKYFPNTGNPNNGTYRYKLGVHDQCGNASALSPYHNTIYMQNNSGTFSWPQLYTIESSANPVTSYVLMRDDNSTGNWQAVNSVAGTLQTAADPSYTTFQATASWRVATQWSIACTPALVKDPAAENFISSRSNIFKSTAVGMNEQNSPLLMTVSPNPSSGTFALQMNNGSLLITDYQLSIFNVLGEKVYSTAMNDRSSTIRLNVPNGVYFLRVSVPLGQPNTRAGTAVKKIIIHK